MYFYTLHQNNFNEKTKSLIAQLHAKWKKNVILCSFVPSVLIPQLKCKE